GVRRLEVALQAIERWRFLDAGLAVGSPEIQDDDFAAIIGKAERLVVNREREIFGGFARDRGFALAVARQGKKDQEREAQCQTGPDQHSAEAFHTSVIIAYRRGYRNAFQPVLMTASRAISAIVPARNEEAVIAASIESLAAQPEIAEIIAVNDQSSDRTQEILQELAQ